MGDRVVVDDHAEAADDHTEAADDHVDVPVPAIVLCGGRGTRLAGEPTGDAIEERPRVRGGGGPLVGRRD
ncbi:hypothetical protein, partial [Halopenitus sp. POP-27]|uniref:hypothetical protein n=1 Tax=Halopenitus sp. POP-27 TaxID=2994425 RepID=UPI0024689256